jgi:large subunit ribosomal protein L13
MQYFRKPLSITRIAGNNPASATRVWHCINGEGHIVGRLATQIATVLQGKHKPIYDKAIDNGDFVVVTNTSKLQFARDVKWERKVYRWHTGHPGGLREVPAERMFAKNPNEILKRAVYGMLPKNPTRRILMQRLRLYSDGQNPHHSQCLEDQNRLMVMQSGLIFDEARPLMAEESKEIKVVEYDPSVPLRGEVSKR